MQDGADKIDNRRFSLRIIKDNQKENLRSSGSICFICVPIMILNHLLLLLGHLLLLFLHCFQAGGKSGFL